MNFCEDSGGKIIFWSPKSARKAIRSLINSGKAGSFEKNKLRPYRCGNHFHFGHDWR